MLDLDTYPIRNLIRPRCAERAKPGRGKPVLIMHIGFLACFHAISLEHSRCKIGTFFFLALVALKFISRLVACSARIFVDTQTHRTTTVTFAAHARRGLTMLEARLNVHTVQIRDMVYCVCVLTAVAPRMNRGRNEAKRGATTV